MIEKKSIENLNAIPLTGSFILQSESVRYQAVFASQNYGTFYTIYAKINFENDLLKSIDLKLVNYKGIINLGFLHPNGGGVEFNFNSKTGTLNIQIVLRGLTQKYESNKIYVGEDIASNDIKQIFVARKLRRLAITGRETNGVFDDEFHYRSGENRNERSPRISWEEDNNIRPKAFDGNCDFSILKTK